MRSIYAFERCVWSKGKMSSIAKNRAWESASYGQASAIWMPVGFLVFVFLLGGGSRSDVMSLPLLRGGAVLFAAWAAARLTRADWRRIRVPLALLLLFTAWIGIQLIPLPPSSWQAFPARDVIARIDAVLGQPDLWRPISLTPSATWNSLLGMTVVFAGLLVAATLRPEDIPRVMFTMVLLACASAVLGFIQALTGSGSPAYLYRITNDGAMVGLFANRNHHAIFLSCAVLVAAMLLRDELMRKRKQVMIRTGLVAAALFLTVVTVLIGSRAGLVSTVVTFLAGYFIVVTAWRASGSSENVGKPLKGISWRRWVLVLPPLVLTLMVGAALVVSGRVSSVSRIAGETLAEDMRVLAWPTVETMIGKFWLLGSGFGSFPATYKMFEPDSLLQPAYFNHAHNDWAELIITGGLPAALIVVFALFWIVRQILNRGMRNLLKGHRGDLRLPFALIILVLAAASFVDYSLRVPSLQVFAILWVVLLCCPPAPRSVGRE